MQIRMQLYVKVGIEIFDRLVNSAQTQDGTNRIRLKDLNCLIKLFQLKLTYLILYIYINMTQTQRMTLELKIF